jgi:hypothetical protein
MHEAKRNGTHGIVATEPSCHDDNSASFHTPEFSLPKWPRLRGAGRLNRAAGQACRTG